MTSLEFVPPVDAGSRKGRIPTAVLVRTPEERSPEPILASIDQRSEASLRSGPKFKLTVQPQSSMSMRTARTSSVIWK